MPEWLNIGFFVILRVRVNNYDIYKPLLKEFEVVLNIDQFKSNIIGKLHVYNSLKAVIILYY